MIRSFSPLSAALVLAIAVLLALQSGVGQLWEYREAPEPPAEPWPVGARDTVRPRLGVTTLAMAQNWFSSWTRDDLHEVNAFEQAAQAHAGIVMWFADWEHNLSFDVEQARAVAARGAIPAISWEPWDAARGTDVPQPRYRLRTIIAGEHDALLRRWGRQMAAYGGPVRLRFAHEMNGDWYPWSEDFNGNADGEFVRAWRHVRRVVREEGATNVQWVWCPVTGRVPVELYPGDDEVDVLGLSGFNGGPHLFSRRWRPFRAAFDTALSDLHELAPDLPVELSEVASIETGGDKAAWIGDMFEEIRARPYLESVVWFEVTKEAEWGITSSPAARQAFAVGLARTRDATRAE